MSTEQAQKLVKEAVTGLRSGDYEKAAELANQAVGLDERYSEAHSIFGIALARIGRTDEATKALQMAIQTGPYQARNYYNLAMHYADTGYKNDGISMCKEAIRCDGNHKAAQALLKRLETETHIQAAPYMTSIGEQQPATYRYKKEESEQDELDQPQ